jgi:hypothetical protein
MIYPKSVIVVITCHGVIQVNKSNNNPKLFKIPSKMKITKLSAVTPGICNLTIDDDIDKFIKLLLNKKNKKVIEKTITNPESYAKSLGNLYETIEKETVDNLYTATPDSNTILRNDYIHHRDKSYKVITYNDKHPLMINKEYSRNNKYEKNISAWDYGIYCINVVGQPDLMTELKGRTYRDKETIIFLEEIITHLYDKGVNKVILIDLSCSNFEYDGENDDKEITVSTRNTRSIRNHLIKEKLNGGEYHRKTQKKHSLLKKRQKNKNKKNNIKNTNKI